MLLAVDSVAADPTAPEQPDQRPPYISAPVYYKEQMLILVTSDGVAAIAFGETFEVDPNDGKLFDGVRYRYRFLPAGGSKERTGEARLAEREVPGEPGLGPDTFIDIGGIRVEWSRGSGEKGWIYYWPEDTAVLIARRQFFDDTEERGPKGPIKVERLDLRRYLKLAPRGAGQR